MSKICAVIGAGPGIGLAVARRFAREGYAVALVSRRPDSLRQYANEIGAAAQWFIADALYPDSLINAFTQIGIQMGAPDVLIYNAAAIRPGRPSSLDAARLTADFTINVTGALVCSAQVIPAMVAVQQGTILFTGSGLATNPTVEWASLALGKAGLRNLAHTMGAELEPLGIHVGMVTIPGTVKKGGSYDPDKIAEKYWELHSQVKGEFQREIVFKK